MPAISASPPPISSVAWRRRRLLPMSRPAFSSLPPIRIAPKAMCSSSRAKALKRRKADGPLKKVSGGLMFEVMTASKAEQVAARTNEAFERLAEPLRREIKLHCYRMLGSLHEAEDLVQETYLRAWRSFGSFVDGSFRAWLYKIATNACLNAIESRKLAQRFLPDQKFPATLQMPSGQAATDVAWLEPYPDINLEGIIDDAPTPE